MTKVAALLLTAALAGCGGAPALSTTAVNNSSPILKTAVLSDGRLLVDGAPSSIPALRNSLRNLAKEKGVVWYYREAASQEPPPIATEVINEVIHARVPIRLSTKPDYSDAVTSP
jgi:hypothetical protein